MPIKLNDDEHFNKNMKKVLDLIKKKKETYIVLVSSPRCGHCIALKETWEKVKKKKNKNIHIIEIDADVAAHLLSDHSYVPELKKLFEGYQHGVPFISRSEFGDVSEFQGERNVEELLQFMA